MSNLLSTSAMVTECGQRLPIGLPSTFWMRKLNEAYRWISQKGNFIWDVKGTDIQILPGVTYFDLPNDCDPGKPMYLIGPSPSMDSLIPYVAWDDAGLQKMSEMANFSGVLPLPGLVSCWSFRTNFTAGPPPLYRYRGYVFPPDCINTTYDFRFVYHTDVSSTELAQATNVFFPTPNSFDNLLIELAEAEARRIYGIVGWDIIQKRAESAITNLLDSYRSTKNVLSGLIDQQKQVNEKKLMTQERQ